jgi:hypothetical protein
MAATTLTLLSNFPEKPASIFLPGAAQDSSFVSFAKNIVSSINNILFF